MAYTPSRPGLNVLTGSIAAGSRSRLPSRFLFAGRGAVPSVYADGPAESPHRYADGSLCMWYPWGPERARWTRRDGAAALLGYITAHLLREEWWRKTSEWVGDEVPHDGEEAGSLDGTTA